MYVSDPVLASQLFASSEVICVYLRKSNDATAIARAIQRHAAVRTPVPIHENTPMTAAELEALKVSLVNEIMGSFSAQLGVQQVFTTTGEGFYSLGWPL